MDIRTISLEKLVVFFLITKPIKNLHLLLIYHTIKQYLLELFHGTAYRPANTNIQFWKDKKTMGVSIHYRGQLNDKALLPDLIDEIRDIANTLDWPTTILDDDWTTPPNASMQNAGVIEGNLGLKGIGFAPHPKSESLSLFFDRDGSLRCPMSMLLILDGTIKPEDAWISVKTQFSNPDTHIWVIGLLKYLKKKYISSLEVSDEGGYWDTGDRKELERRMNFINEKIDSLSASLSSSSMGDLSNLSADEIAKRIEKFFLDNDNQEDKQ